MATKKYVKKDEAADEGPCVVPGCESEDKRRWKGLCPSCYFQAKELVKEKKETWESLEALGLAKLPVKPFIEAYRKAKEAKR